MFCTTVGQASFQTARGIGPSTSDRSNLERTGAACAGGAAFAGTSAAAVADVEALGFG
jgi:hypothetical protein